MKKIMIMPGKESFENIINLIELLEEKAKNSKKEIEIIFLGENKKSVEIAARLLGYGFVPTDLERGKNIIQYHEKKTYGKKRAYITCFAQYTVEGRLLIIEDIKPDIVICSRNLQNISFCDLYIEDILKDSKIINI